MGYKVTVVMIQKSDGVTNDTPSDFYILITEVLVFIFNFLKMNSRELRNAVLNTNKFNSSKKRYLLYFPLVTNSQAKHSKVI